MSDRSGDAEDTSTEALLVDPSDLLVRLRDAEFDADDMLIGDVKALFKEAADEIERLRGLAGSDSAPGVVVSVAEFAGRLPGPALERRGEGRLTGIAEIEGNLAEAQVGSGDVSLRQVVAQPVEDFIEAGPFTREPAGQGSVAHPELRGDDLGTRVSRGKEVHNQPLDLRHQPGAFLTAFHEHRIGKSPQDTEEPVIRGRNWDREVLGFEDNAGAALAVADPASEETRDISQPLAPMMDEDHFERRDVLSCEVPIGLDNEADTELHLLSIEWARSGSSGQSPGSRCHRRSRSRTAPLR